jgi:hypothetical protein
MSSAGFERAIRAGERPQTYTLDRAATGDRRDENFRFEFRANLKLTRRLTQNFPPSCVLE